MISKKRIGKNGYIVDNSDNSDYSITPADQIEWCQFCAHYGFVDNYNVCADGNVLSLSKHGVEIVSKCGWCRHFIHINSEDAKKINYSPLKQYMLNQFNFRKEK